MDRVIWLDRVRGILHWRFYEGQSSEEILVMFDRFREIVEAAEHPKVHSILDFSGMNSSPADVISRFPAMGLRLPRFGSAPGIVAVVSQRIFFNVLASIFSRVYKFDFVYFDSFDAAYQYILEQADSASPADSG